MDDDDCNEAQDEGNEVADEVEEVVLSKVASKRSSPAKSRRQGASQEEIVQSQKSKKSAKQTPAKMASQRSVESKKSKSKPKSTTAKKGRTPGKSSGKKVVEEIEDQSDMQVEEFAPAHKEHEEEPNPGADEEEDLVANPDFRMEVDEEADEVEEVPELNRTSNSQMGFFAVGGEAEPSAEREDAEMEEEERGRSPVKSAKKSAKKSAGKASVQKSAKASVKKA